MTDKELRQLAECLSLWQNIALLEEPSETAPVCNGQVAAMIATGQQAADTILALLDRLRAAEAGWQPIETAPLEVDVLVSGYQYNDPAQERFMDVAAVDKHGRWLTYDCKDLYQPTHWMPLPSQPET